ncbi:hypothetical protein CPU12_06110 [Malaciobacter molluscorum LMG 25693]|uniref:Uncharacterized protein n=1 Tax=Malaciobacter molluscorum LMG 25693 TaxID=870501 RepID=A0A2G1DIK5_9BACT|nr:hypothetical protein [Malaciobacter molluscorum]AXX91882.1 hypothetical protein AMOL_0888 [Malaciobacter molluscorum LMG 25693]PHO18291.1 hypothetical protein CPU12_06110 [Malaciobacter molluscorum LMG 25693]
MKLLFLLFLFSIFMFASSYKYNHILMEGEFDISYNKNKTKNLKFFYNLGIYYNLNNIVKLSSFCFFTDKDQKKLNENGKSKYKICVKAKENNFYVLNKSNGYTKTKMFIAKLKNARISILDNKNRKLCSLKASTYASINKKINNCLKKSNNI